MVKKLKKTVKKKIGLKEKKLSKINVKIASIEQKAAKRKAKKSTASINN